jgi:hypothetical protein
MATKAMNIVVDIKQDPIEIVVHVSTESTNYEKKTKVSEREKAQMELLANYPEVFTHGVLQDIRLDMPSLTPTEAAIVMESAPIIKQWKDFVIFIFQIYPHDRIAQNMKRVEHLWPHVLRLQGKDPDCQ